MRGYNGPLRKEATVISNDPEQGSLILTVKGMVRQLVQVRPGTNVSFRGTADQAPEAVIDLIGMDQPFQISKMESNLEERVSYRLQTVAAGRHYQLKVHNLLAEGNYSGYIMLTSDLPRGQIPTIHVTGRIEGEISITPKSILLGKLPRRSAESSTVTVRSNGRKPFQINRLDYDANLLKVEVQPLSDKSGYSLEVSAIMPNVPAGNSVATTLSVQTDLNPQVKEEVQIRLINPPN